MGTDLAAWAGAGGGCGGGTRGGGAAGQASQDSLQTPLPGLHPAPAGCVKCGRRGQLQPQARWSWGGSLRLASLSAGAARTPHPASTHRLPGCFLA